MFKKILFVLVMVSCSFLYAEIKHVTMSNGTPYAYYVPDKPSSDSGGSSSSGSSSSNSGSQSSGNSSVPAGPSSEEQKAAAEKNAEILKAEKRAKDSESAMESAVAAVKDIKKKLNYTNNLLQGAGKSYRTKDELIRDKATFEKALEHANKHCKEMSDRMCEAYDDLGKTYEKYNWTGDPVGISSGNYIADYVDFLAQDYLQAFQVSRSLLPDVVCESFGKGWFSSLDSRILRCFMPGYEGAADSIDQTVAAIDEFMRIYEDYKKRDLIMSVFYNAISKDQINEFTATKNELQEIKEYIEDVERIRNYLIHRNHYVKYGLYSGEDSPRGTSEMLIYLDEKGRDIPFKYEGNGIWKPMSELSSARYYLQGLNADGGTDSSCNAEGGYIIHYSDGHKKCYSYYGILEREVDPNGNETIYRNQNGKINQVVLKTGEVINISRDSNGKITAIEGAVSGKTSYVYNGNWLTSVISNDGVPVSYTYDEMGKLEKIIKVDNSFVQLEHEFIPALCNYVCTSVSNEKSETEYFDYDVPNKKTTHRTVEGDEEIYVYDSWGAPVYVKDAYGREINIERDSHGLIKTFTEDGVSRRFVYNSLFRPVQIIDDDGSVQKLEYNSRGQLTCLEDPDGFSMRYEYDDRGNLLCEYFENEVVSSASYYPNGLVKSRWEDGVSWDYEYNCFGSLVKVIYSLPSYGSLVREMEYDSKNRLTKIKDYDGSVTDISYDTSLNKRTEKIDGKLIIERFFDCKNREIKVISKDLSSGQSYTKENVYDGHGNIIKTFINGELYKENTFSSSDLLLEKTEWNLIGSSVSSSKLAKQGVRISYAYDDSGFLTSETYSTVEGESAADSLSSLRRGEITFKQLSYKRDGEKTLVTCKNQMGVPSFYEFDKYGRMVKKVFEDGFTKTWTYSRGGRLKSENDSSNNLMNYIYRKDGSFYVTGQKSGLTITQEFDCYGRLVSIRDYSGNVFERFYDENGRKIKEREPGYEILNEYDIFGRMLSSKTFDNAGNLCRAYSASYDGDSLSLYHNDRMYQKVTFDSWSRPLEVLDKNGCVSFSYDVLSNPVKITYGNGLEIRGDYNGAGQLGLSESNQGGKVSYFYDSTGVFESSYLHSAEGDSEIISMNRNLDDKSLVSKDFYGVASKSVCDEKGRLVYLDNQKNGTYQFSYGDYSYSRIDENGNEYKYEYDLYGRIIREIDSLGNEMTYEYDAFNRVKKKVDFNGRTFLYQYDDESFKTIITSDSGKCLEIVRNPLGQVLKLKSDSCDYQYKYNEAGELVLFRDDISQVEIEYFYDDFGRCVEKKSNSFDFVYSYDEVGLVSKICDLMKNVWVAFEYDLNGNETKRSFSNGNEVCSEYDFKGLLSARISKDCIGQIVSSEIVERDVKGRIVGVKDKNGKKTCFAYDENGRLVESIYPFVDSLGDYYLKDARACGLYVKEFPGDLEEWKTSFEYDSKGNVVSVQNPLGKFIYEYDSMNRLVSKYGENSKDNGMHFIWDRNGNLTGVISSEFEVSLEYGPLNRPEKIITKDYENSTIESLSFSYDPWGRRIRECKNESESKVFVYDGMSLDVIQIVPLLMNQSAVTNYVPVSDQVNLEPASVRWIDDSSFSASGEVRSMDLDFHKSDLQVSIIQSCETRPFSVISKDGLVCAYLYSDFGFDESVKVECLIPNYRDNIVAVCDAFSNLTYENCMDVWGNELSNGKNYSYSYSQSNLDCGLHLINLGFRDYCPAMKCFISQDPVRDGQNWFAFCPGDPLNYCDRNGLEVGVIKEFYNMSNYEKQKILLGNSGKEIYNEKGVLIAPSYVHLEGCYITTMANISYSMNNGKENNVVDPKYSDPLAINDNKELFAQDSGCIDRKKSMDTIFGEGNWDYWTAANSTPYMLRAQMAKYKALRGDFYFIGVFDLSAATECAKNHMVGLNDVFDETGHLNDKSDVACTSSGDRNRIYTNNRLDVYNLSNLKELRIIGLETSGCNK